MTAPDQPDAEALLSSLTRALTAVAVLTLLFTAVNVTLFATDHGVPWPIALLLDPMVALALAAVLLADARLTTWDLQPPGWSTTLRWFTGCTAALMNTWTSLWPDGHVGWPHHADPAGVLLHAVPPVLLILLTETVAAYRHRLTQIRIPTTAETADRPPDTTSTATANDAAPHGNPHAPRSSPHLTPVDPEPPPGPVAPADADLFARALALDTAHLDRTGRPLSIRSLREQLHLGQPRAREVRTRLDAHHARTRTRERDVPESHIVPGQEHRPA